MSFFDHEQLFEPSILHYLCGHDVGVGSNAQFTPNGNKLVIHDLAQGNYVLNFDRCLGTLSAMKFLPFNDTLYCSPTGMAISANSRYLYDLHCGQMVRQYDLEAGNEADIIASQQIVAVNDSFRYEIAPGQFSYDQWWQSAYLAPDNKIYLGTSYHYMTTIESPDVGGIGCNVQQHSTRLRGISDSNFPAYINYRLGADTTCVIATETSVHKESIVKVFPNPASNHVNIAFSHEIDIGKFEVFDVLGHSVYSINTQNSQNLSINTENWTQGIKNHFILSNPKIFFNKKCF